MVSTTCSPTLPQRSTPGFAGQASERSYLKELLAKENGDEAESGDSEEDDADESGDELEDARAEQHCKNDVVHVVEGSIVDSIQTSRIPISQDVARRRRTPQVIDRTLVCYTASLTSRRTRYGRRA